MHRGWIDITWSVFLEWYVQMQHFQPAEGCEQEPEMNLNTEHYREQYRNTNLSEQMYEPAMVHHQLRMIRTTSLTKLRVKHDPQISS